MTPWRNGSASDSRSEGCVFKSRRGQIFFVVDFHFHFVFQVLNFTKISIQLIQYFKFRLLLFRFNKIGNSMKNNQGTK